MALGILADWDAVVQKEGTFGYRFWSDFSFPRPKRSNSIPFSVEGPQSAGHLPTTTTSTGCLETCLTMKGLGCALVQPKECLERSFEVFGVQFGAAERWTSTILLCFV